jgi:hypothetical protein
MIKEIPYILDPCGYLLWIIQKWQYTGHIAYSTKNGDVYHPLF